MSELYMIEIKLYITHIYTYKQWIMLNLHSETTSAMTAPAS